MVLLTHFRGNPAHGFITFTGRRAECSACRSHAPPVRPPPAPISVCFVRHKLSRPHQPCICSHRYATRPGFERHRHRLRYWCFLHQLRCAADSRCIARGTLERTRNDLHNPGRLGDDDRTDRSGAHAASALRRPLLVGRSGSWFLPWRDRLPESLVPSARSWESYEQFHVRDPGFFCSWFAARCLILGQSWHSFAGWRWLFILEGMPAIVLGGVVYFFLPDLPQHAKWLTVGAACLARIEPARRARNQSKGDAGAS